ncbi:hypothetical protein [Pseudoalteromonas sp. SR41-6]|uniref:hypothetical protein n=1 Tax=Pseudoalteromonas sp. SR41-6 TaxID=2760948 RepID=UPI0015FED7D4|nr:hypothetical protein [Pseudoalteromonas sp. SR41-6]MBB1334001.1 hypothetical protein [Pseudoalteromonas sp. SR41-6]
MAVKLNKKKAVVGFILVIITVTAGAYFNNDSGVDDSKLERLMKTSTPSINKEIIKVNKESAIKVKSSSASEDDIRFVVSRDFNAVIACSNMLSNSLNKETQAQWLQQRLSKNAQRERTQMANLTLEEQEASFKALQLQKKEEALKNTKVDNFNFQGFLDGESNPDQISMMQKDVWPEIKLQSISDDAKATFSMAGELFIERKQGEIFDKFLLSKIEYLSGCISFVGNESTSQFKRVCM